MSGGPSREEIFTIYRDLPTFEHHFNTIEGGIRALASVWLLTAVGAVAFVFRSGSTGLVVSPTFGLAAITLMGTVGLLTLSLLDLLVYQRLLDAAFVTGLVLEHFHGWLPPIRTMMFRNAGELTFAGGRRTGMSAVLRLFYFVPCGLLSVIGIVGVSVMPHRGSSATWVGAVALLAAQLLLLVYVVRVQSRLSADLGNRCDEIRPGLGAELCAQDGQVLLARLRIFGELLGDAEAVDARQAGGAESGRVQ